MKEKAQILLNKIKLEVDSNWDLEARGGYDITSTIKNQVDLVDNEEKNDKNNWLIMRSQVDHSNVGEMIENREGEDHDGPVISMASMVARVRMSRQLSSISLSTFFPSSVFLY